MKNEFLIVLVLGIIHSILFVNYFYGLNVLLFTICFLLFLYIFLKKNKLIKNRFGLLFMIPILLLSIHYVIYHDSFYYLNVFAIPLLYLLLFIYTVKPIQNIENLIIKIPYFLIKPLDHIGKVWKKYFNSISGLFKIGDRNKQILVSILVIIPIVFIVLLLLSSADMIFHEIFKDFFELFHNITFGSMIGRVIRYVFFITYVGCTIYYVSHELGSEDEKERKKFSNPYTMKLLLTVLNVIYILFDIIQIRSLVFHMGLHHINYAEYARSGFFQLMFISVINLTILLLSKRYEENKYNKWMSVFMVCLTIVIIFSSFFRMFLYEQAYGYTLLRLGVYAILITELVLFIPTIFYIFNSKISILKYYLIIVVCIYSFINCFSVDRIITANNIKRYYKVEDIDLDYLENGCYDNIPQLYDFLNELDKDSSEFKELNKYLNYMSENNDYKLLEFNFSKYKVKKKSS